MTSHPIKFIAQLNFNDVYLAVSCIILLHQLESMKSQPILLGDWKENESPIIVASDYQAVPIELKKLEDKGIHSELDLIEKICKETPDRPLAVTINEKDKSILSYEEVRKLGEYFARGMLEMKLAEKIMLDGKETRVVGFFLRPSYIGPVMLIASQYMCSMVNFLYTDPIDHFAYNADKGMFDTVVVDTEYLDFLLTPIEKKEIRIMKNFVLFKDVKPELLERVRALGSNIFYYEDIIEKGKNSTMPLIERPNSETRFLNVSTSGSTGLPKAATCCHKCCPTNAYMQYGFWNDLLKDHCNMMATSTLGYGTVAVFSLTVMGHGGTLTYLNRKCANYFEEMRVVDPTFLVWAPLVFNKVYQALQQIIEELPSPKREGIKQILEKKLAFYNATKQYKHPELDKMLEPFRANFFGKNLKFIMCIGARISNQVMNFIRILTGVQVCNCYGTTETCGFVTLSSDTDDADCIGRPLPWYEIKIIDVPESNYFVKDVINGKRCPRGEMCVRGNIFECYLNDPKRTAEVKTEDGWYKTGDIVLLREDNSLQIIDRRSQIVKLTCVFFYGIY